MKPFNPFEWEQRPEEAWTYKKKGFLWTKFDNRHEKTGREVTALTLEHLRYQLWTGSLLCPDTSSDRPRWTACIFEEKRLEENALPSPFIVYDVQQDIESAKGCLKDFKYIAYTAHKHSEENPSLKIVLMADKVCKLSKKEYLGVAKLLGLKITPISCHLSHAHLFPPENALYGNNSGLFIPVSKFASY